MSKLISDLVKNIESGNEYDQTLLATIYVNSELKAHRLLPLESDERRFFIKNYYEPDFPDKAFGRNITEVVIQRFIDHVLKDGASSPYVQHIFPIKARDEHGYHGKCRIYDEYFLLWNMAYIYFKQKEYENAACLLTYAQIIEGKMLSLPLIRTSRDLEVRDVCSLTSKEIALAQYNLASSLEKNGGNNDQNYRKAAAYYDFAARAGNDSAMTNLARLYHEGKGVMKDDGKALSLLKEAVNTYGNSHAKEYLLTNFPEERPVHQTFYATTTLNVGENAIVYKPSVTGATITPASDSGNTESSDCPTNSPFHEPRYGVINGEFVELSPEDCRDSGSVKVPRILF